MDAAAAGRLIRRRRQLLGMTQDDLAKRIGADRSAVSAWERGVQFPLRFQGRVEDALGISLEDEPPPLPDLVARNQHDPRVMTIWGLTELPEQTRLGMISWLLRQDQRGSAAAR